MTAIRKTRLRIKPGQVLLVIVMSVMNGFRAELFDRFQGLNGHAVAQGYGGRLPDWRRLEALLEHAQGRGWGAPRYDVLGQEGPEHGKRYIVVAKVRNEVWGEGEGPSKKDAEQIAARQALESHGIRID